MCFILRVVDEFVAVWEKHTGISKSSKNAVPEA
jgi:hypothetical protein